MFWKGRIRKGRAEQSEAKTVQWTVFRTRLGESISADITCNKEIIQHSVSYGFIFMFWKGKIRKGRAEQSEAKTVQWTVFRTRLGGSIPAKSK